MPEDRSRGRNVHIYSAKDPNTVLGGLLATGGTTNANFYSMVEIVFLFDSDYTLCSETGTTVQRDDHPLQAGKYLIHTAGSLRVNNEPWLVRTRSVGRQTPPESFSNVVHERDYRCVITGLPTLYEKNGDWIGFKATPIFPLIHEQHWVTHGYDSWITIPGSNGSNISSVQNGIMLREDISILFESYILAINPDDGYKIVFFKHNIMRVTSTHLDKTLLEHSERPVDQLLRWHFRQAVLANVRGQGERCFDFSSPPPLDIMDLIGEINWAEGEDW